MRSNFIDFLKRTKAVLKSSVTTAILILALLVSSPAKALLFDVQPDGSALASGSSYSSSLSTTKIVLMSVGALALAGGVCALLLSSSSNSNASVLSSAKAITAYSIGHRTGMIDENKHTIAVDLPYGTNVTSLIATFTTTGASIKVSSTPQASGVTANDFTSPVIYTVTAADGSTAIYTVTVTVAKSSDKRILEYFINDVEGIINETTNTIAITMPYGTDVTNLIAEFEFHGSSIAVNGISQISEQTPNNFTNPVVYTVTAANSSTANYTVTVTVASASAKAITLYSIGDSTGKISGQNITVTVPFDTDITKAVATFDATSKNVKVGTVTQISKSTPNNFTNPVIYTVTAADGSTANYTVTVTVAQSSDKKILWYDIDDAIGDVDETNKTISVEVPFGADVADLVAEFDIAGSKVTVNGVTQESDDTSNDFTNPVIYTVTAADASTVAYTVTVTVAIAEPVAIKHTCTLLADGSVKCWGGNNYGQLGNGTTTNSSVPVSVTDLSSGVTAIAANRYHTCALLVDGSVKCWGFNSDGQLGNGATTNSSVPVSVTDLGGVVTAIAAGGNHTCALLADGSVKCWGYNAYGQLGNNITNNSSIPVSVVGLGGVVAAIAAGSSHTCALLADGSVKCWGFNNAGQLGNGTTTNSSVPVSVTGLGSGVTAIAAGGYHACALLADGSIKCWGGNVFGQLGNGANIDSPVPISVTDLGGVVAAIAAGLSHTCALLADGSVKCWGLNNYGQLGNNTTSDSSVPVSVTSLSSGVTAIAAGDRHTCSLLAVGSIKCWGGNNFGQLGNGTTTDSPTPVTVV